MARSTAIVAVIFSLVSPLRGQTVTGNLEGTTLDQTGEPVAGASIMVSGPSLIGTKGASTDALGHFRILALTSGEYVVRISHVSYKLYTISGVRIQLGITTSIGQVYLTPQAVELGPVTVAGERQPIDVTSTALGQNLTDNYLDGLPLDRDYQGISKLLPQANESFYGDGTSVAGATGLENKYFINGVDVTDPFQGKSPTSLPYNYVKEIQLKTGAYGAEYQGSLGGVLNVVTYSGGDEFHGNLFGFFTNNNFAGSPLQAINTPPKSKYSQYDVGFSFGGPILQKKLWFFLAYDPSFSRENVLLTGLNNYYTSSSVGSLFASKFSWHADEHNDVTLSVFGDPATGRWVRSYFYAALNPDPFLYKTKSGGVNVLASGTHVLSENLLLESNISWIQRTDDYNPETLIGQTQPLFLDYVNVSPQGAPTASGGGPERNNESSTEISAGVKLTILANSHTLKAGLEYTSLRHNTDSGRDIYTANADGTFSEIYQQFTGNFGQHIPSVFVQDSWKVLPSLTLNGGIRWDPQFLIGSDGGVDQKILSQYSPRFGIIYLPGGDESQKITVSAGRFYQLLSMYLSLYHHNAGSIFRQTVWGADPRTNPNLPPLFMNQTVGVTPSVPDLKGQYHDEVTLGYERYLGVDLKAGIRGVYRTLRWGIEDGQILSQTAPPVGVYGNPGLPPMQDWPKMVRDYKALEVSLEEFGGGPFNFLVSYVLSRTYGNYPGLYEEQFQQSQPNSGTQFEFPEMLVNATGLLPNDRTHVFKFLGSYAFDFGVTAGTSFILETGSPRSELKWSTVGFPYYDFVTQRGTGARMASLWDLNFRLMYELNRVLNIPPRARLIVDMFHIGSPRKAVDFDQVEFLDNAQTIPNPTYGDAIQFQPPMSVRVGLEVNF